MRNRTFSTVFIGLIFVATPFYLGARTAPQGLSGLTTQARVTTATVHSIQVTSRLDTRSQSDLKVAITAHNPTAKPTTARVKVDVYERAPSSPMARMVPPPRYHGSHILELTLAPHQRLTRTVLIKAKHRLSKASVTTYYTRLSPAPARAPQALNHPNHPNQPTRVRHKALAFGAAAGAALLTVL